MPYYKHGRGQYSVRRDAIRSQSCPVLDPVEASSVPVWSASYGTRWAVNTSRLDLLTQRGDGGGNSIEEYGSCGTEDFTAHQLRMLEAAIVFEKSLIYFLYRECDESVSFLISLFEFRPLSVPIPAIASIYDKYAPISIKRAGIWERMIAKL